MAYSYITYTGSSSSSAAYAITFPYIDVSNIYVYLNGTIAVYGTNYSISNNAVRFTTGQSGKTIFIQRKTKLDARLIDFSDGAVLTEADLDSMSLQLLYVSQELSDALGQAMGQASDGTLNATNRKITNLAYPINPTDAASMQYVLDQLTQLGNVPLPVATDNGKWLKATGAGLYTWDTISVPATSVSGLGTAATKNTGNPGVSNVIPVLSRSGSLDPNYLMAYSVPLSKMDFDFQGAFQAHNRTKRITYAKNCY